MNIISKRVWILSLVSMFADIASEMLYPVIPVYLRNIGFSVLLIGILEGIAEFTVGLSKGYFVKLSDSKGVRLPFIRLGYFLSALSKPMMAMFTHAGWILFARTTDRLGKGIRTAARDALLSEEATTHTKASVFGFHRTWDTTGAIIGPLLALALLQLQPANYSRLFYLAFIPGMIAVLLIFLLREKPLPVAPGINTGFFSFLGYWKKSHPDYRKLMIALSLFALANSSDVFLLLQVKQITGDDTTTILVYLLYNVVFALMSFPAGMFADRIGLKKILITGLMLFIVVYGGFAVISEPWMAFVLFVIYGIYAACTEGIARAWITNLATRNETATAIGLFTALQSIGALAASTLAGLLWYYAGSQVVFIFSAALVIVIVIGLTTTRLEEKA